MSSPCDKFIRKVVGVYKVARICTICGFRDSYPRSNGVVRFGRGHGFCEGNRSRGRLIQHIRSEHPVEVPRE